MIDTLADMLKWLDQIQGISAVALVVLFCVCVGYLLKFIRAFPNEAIPPMVIVTGAVVMLLLADPRGSAMPARVWAMRNFGVGIVLGTLSWMLHVIVLKRIETYISNKFDLGNTSFFNKQRPDEHDGA